MNDKLVLMIQNRLSNLPSGLIKHIQTVEAISVDLAKIHGIDIDKARLCAQAHDLFRSEKSSTLIDMAQKLGIKINSVERELPILLHGPVAAVTLWKEGMTDPEIYQGIYYHSTACPGLMPVGKTVFLADKLDPNKIKRYPYLPSLLTLSQKSLDEGLMEFLNKQLAYHIEHGELVHPASLDARNELLLHK